jgi:hypothetical protein
LFGRARTELYLSGCETNWNDFAIEAEISSNRYFALAKNPDLSSLRKKSRWLLLAIFQVKDSPNPN